MLPLVESPRQVRSARGLLQRAARRVRRPEPLLGAMVETPKAVQRAAELAVEADFFSIGTNDLVATTLGIDRDGPGASPLSAGDPAVVELIRRAVDAAHAAGIPVEVCGEAAGEPALTPLFVALGVDELSVAPSRLDTVRDAIRRSGEAGDEVRQLGDGLGGVVA
jgi:phosphoenolpyruvate-protein kinase (PTS system EI component)